MLNHFNYKEAKAVLKSAVSPIAIQNPTKEECLIAEKRGIYFVPHIKKDQKAFARQILKVLEKYLLNEAKLEKIYALRDRFLSEKDPSKKLEVYKEFKGISTQDNKTLEKYNKQLRSVLDSILQNFEIKSVNKQTRQVALSVKSLSKEQRALLDSIYSKPLER